MGKQLHDVLDDPHRDVTGVRAKVSFRRHAYDDSSSGATQTFWAVGVWSEEAGKYHLHTTNSPATVSLISDVLGGRTDTTS